VEAIASILGAVRKQIHLPNLLLQVNCSDVHRARQYCFGLRDLIRYFQNPGEDLFIQVVATTA